MSAAALHPLRALRQGLCHLKQQPQLALGFSAMACGVHLLGWALFAAGHGTDSAVLALLLHGVGLALYAGSLVWLVDGLTRIGLALSAGQPPLWRSLCRWHRTRSRDLALGLLNTALALAAAALAGFMAWSLLLFLIPPLSPLPALLGLAAVVALGLSQLFNACLVLDRHLSPSLAFGRGLELLRRHWGRLPGLGLVLLAILALPFALGLLAEAVLAGLGGVITVLAMVAALPLLACTVAVAYRQLALSPAAR